MVFQREPAKTSKKQQTKANYLFSMPKSGNQILSGGTTISAMLLWLEGFHFK